VGRNRADRAAAWIVTGPLGHLWSVTADVVVLWVRWGLSRLRKEQRPASRRAL
jgi:hypothetical protein